MKTIFFAEFVNNQVKNRIQIECTPTVIHINNKVLWFIDDIIKIELKNLAVKLNHKNGDVLIIENQPDFLIYCKHHYRQSRVFNPKKFVFYKYKIGFIFLFISILTIIFLVSLVWTIQKKADWVISHSNEKKIGEILYKNTIKNYIINDSATHYIQQFFNQIKWTKEDEIKVIVVKKNEINAFAMPGGYIFVYDSILKIIQNENQLAGLLAHEYSHLQLRHSVRSLILKYGLTFLWNIIIGEWGALNNIFIAINELNYSRNMELEADANAAIILNNKKISTYGLISLFDVMEIKLSNELKTPSMFSSHPDFKERKNKLLPYLNKDNFKNQRDTFLISYFQLIQKKI